MNARLRELVWLVALAVYGLTGAGKAEESKRLLLIDDDLGMDKRAVRKAGTYWAPALKFTDPDGGPELIYALRAPGVEVVGITCVMGCSTLAVCMSSGEEILRRTGRDEVPLLRGAESSADLGRPTPAAEFIVNTVMARPGQVEIVATAPLTNIATALMLEPRIAENWKALHVGTGEFMGALGEWSDGAAGRVIGYKDLNINVDPEAARYVLDHAGTRNVLIYPNEIMDDAWLSPADLRKLGRTDTDLARYVSSELHPFSVFALTIGRLAGMRGFVLHGAIPLAIALDPSLAQEPQMLRVNMSYRKLGGWYFTVTDDPAVPERPVYAKLGDPGMVVARLMARLQ
jgi:inosine-uridine nucleoside N-ribohydrolase